MFDQFGIHRFGSGRLTVVCMEIVDYRFRPVLNSVAGANAVSLSFIQRASQVLVQVVFFISDKFSPFNIMKASFIAAACLLTCLAGYAQTLPNPNNNSAVQMPLPDTSFQAISRNANETIWQKTSYEVGTDGNQYPHIHTVTELTTGLNHWIGEWVPSDENIITLPDGTAAATNGSHQVYFPADIYNGVIKVITPCPNDQFMRLI